MTAARLAGHLGLDEGPDEELPFSTESVPPIALHPALAPIRSPVTTIRTGMAVDERAVAWSSPAWC